MEQLQTGQDPHYMLGHADHELDRLITQARFIGDLTEHVLRLAGLGPGMRVLDVGCGPGDVTFLAAKLVGPTGTVIGVDKSPETITFAAQRASAAGLTNVHFLTRDLADLVLDEPVDALIGRLVLMYFPAPAELLRRLTEFVKPGGFVAFHELDTDGAQSEPHCAIYERAIQRIRETFRRIGVDTRTGIKLGRIFEAAGLPAAQLILSARVERGPDSLLYDQVAQITRTLLPLMQRTEVASLDEVGIETLASRMREEAMALNATLVFPSFIGAWTRKGRA